MSIHILGKKFDIETTVEVDRCDRRYTNLPSEIGILTNLQRL